MIFGAYCYPEFSEECNTKVTQSLLRVLNILLFFKMSYVGVVALYNVLNDICDNFTYLGSQLCQFYNFPINIATTKVLWGTIYLQVVGTPRVTTLSPTTI